MRGDLAIVRGVHGGVGAHAAIVAQGEGEPFAHGAIARNDDARVTRDVARVTRDVARVTDDDAIVRATTPSLFATSPSSLAMIPS